MEVDSWTVFLGPEGGWRIIAGFEGPLHSLTWNHGARQAWRASRQGDQLCVEGFAAEGSCRILRKAPKTREAGLVSSAALYQVA
jgi:hypothetical protein